MDFESSSLWIEAKEIVTSKTLRKLYDHKGTIHTTKEDFPVWDMNIIEITRDYSTKVCEAGKVVFKLGLGDYVHRLYPYRNNLEFTIKSYPKSETNGRGEEEGAVEVTRYKAIFNPAQNPPVGGSELEGMHPEDLNTKDVAEIHLEIVDRSAEALRIKTTGGAFRNVTPESVITSVLAGESLKVLVDGKPSIDGIDVVKPDNSEKIPNLIIPHGTKITSVPTFLHQDICGVYNRGIGTFLQKYKKKKRWYVYPTYDTERFDGKDPKVIFYLVPQNRLPNLDRSYKEDGDILKVVISAQRIYTDSAELNLMNKGSGYRMPDARSFMKKPVEMGSDGPVGSRTRLNHEVSIKAREDGLNYVPVVSGPSSNPFLQRSIVLSHYLAQYDFVWENGDSNLIYPGMPCKCLYLSQGKVQSLKGTILFTTSVSTKNEKYNATPFRTVVRISVACEPKTNVPDLPSKEAVGD